MDIKMLFGYYGRHDRGTNEFEAVDGLAVCGDPRGNLGDAQQDANLVEVDVDTLYGGKTMATSVQAINRARHLRRSNADRVVLMFVGDNPPEIRGFSWEEEELSRRAYKTYADDLKRLVTYIAQNDGVYSSATIKEYPLDLHPDAPSIDMLELHPNKVQRAMRGVSVDLNWVSTEIKIDGRYQKVYSSSPEYARAWVNCGCPVGFFNMDYTTIFT
tara:strand:- start:349 stop:993 length:645 start_codon:yes stop_codon:yes gene_type:complete